MNAEIQTVDAESHFQDFSLHKGHRAREVESSWEVRGPRPDKRSNRHMPLKSGDAQLCNQLSCLHSN